MKRLFLLALLLTGCATTPRPEPFDLVLSGGTVYSGDDTPPVQADVGIRGGRIVAVGDLSGMTAAERMDISGLVVAPGFIDIHSHAVRGSKEHSGLFRHPDAENYVRQGVTSVIGGPDGGSWLPLATLFAELEAQPAAVHFGSFVGHNTIRQAVMGREDRAPSDEELVRMQALVEQAMREGAFGLSTGLKYMPGAFSETEEVIALAAVAGRHGGIHISHMREEGLRLLDSVGETIRIGEEGGLPTQITHHKAVGAPMWGASEQSLALVEAARARGVDVSIDQYPYTASSTDIAILFPAWAQEGSWAAQKARFADRDTAQRIREGVIDNLVRDRGGNDPARVVLADCGWDASKNGMSLADVLRDQDREVSIGNAADLAMEIYLAGGCMTVFHAMDEADVQRILRHPVTMVGSDGGIHAPGEGVPHPRNYGAFARVLQRYVRELGVLPLHTAIHKMSAMPADRLGLADRGRIAPGMFADLAVFDPSEVAETSRFGDPHHYAEGMVHVFVAGQAVLQDGAMTGARPGRVLRSTSLRAEPSTGSHFP